MRVQCMEERVELLWHHVVVCGLLRLLQSRATCAGFELRALESGWLHDNKSVTTSLLQRSCDTLHNVFANTGLYCLQDTTALS